MKKYYLKEDVEFERLKDFGFEPYYNDETPYLVIGYTTGGLGNIYIDIETREVYKNTDIMPKLNDLFNELIKANLVEERDE